jgi:hypothetical protein
MPKENFPQVNDENKVEPLQRAWSDAADRVKDLSMNDSEVEKRDVVDFTSSHDKEEIQKYLNANKEILKPEEVFLLEVTIHLRSAKGFDVVQEFRKNESNS